MPSLSANRHDIAVIGGGIVGLWTAFEAARQGRSVVLLEKRHIGAGASGGLLGALMPHQATSWNAKKQFQLDGLLTLEDEITALEELTGIDTGYRRCGRLMPIRNAEKRRKSDEWAGASHDAWPYPYRWMVAEATIYSDWLSPDEMPLGTNADNLSARVDPRNLVAALRKALELSGVAIREETTILFDDTRKPLLPDGTPVVAGHVVLSAGWQTFGLVDPEFAEHITRFKMRGSSGKVNLALDRLPEFTCRPGNGPHLRGDIAIAPSIDYLERAYDDCKHGRPSAGPAAVSSVAGVPPGVSATPGVAATSPGAAVSSVTAGAGSIASGSGGGNSTNQIRITTKLSAVARMRFLF